ncbi:MAG: NADH-quinone oxidoreductase subunit NuoK [Candidatus Methylacidiphilales bacterium]
MNVITEITLNHYLALSGILFAIGAAGVLLRRNLIIIYMCLELMLNAANLALISFDRFSVLPSSSGQVMVFFIITVAAAEVAVGLALIVALYRMRRTTEVGALSDLKF